MTKRNLILIGIVALLALGVYSLWNWRAKSRQRQLETYAAQVNDADPYRRLLAVEGLLRHKPGDEANQLIRAKALIELNRHAEAREEIQSLIDRKSPNIEQLAALQIESLFTEARRLVDLADRQRSDTTVERVETLMTAVQSQSALITGRQRVFDIMLIEARRLDTLAAAYRFALQGRQVELTKARIGGIQQTIETVGLEVTEWENKVKALDEELVRVCGRITQVQPENPVGAEMLFRGHLRRQEFAQARSVARSMTAWKEIPATVVARVSDALLDMEARFGEPVTADDVALAGLLLEHPNQPGEKGIDHQLALATYALARGDAATATKYAHAVVAKEWLHARALCIAAHARILDGEPMRGVEILQKYTELKRDPLVRYTLGLAYLATGEPRQVNLGQEALRQCLDIEPNHLPARLRLIESLVSTGHIIQAGDDINVVEQISPRHPRVVALKAQLAIETEDLAMIGMLIDTQLSADAAALRAGDIALVAAMVLDDVPRVRRLMAELKTMQAQDVLVLLADRWVESEPMRRARVAPAIARHLHEHLMSDPLSQPLPPASPVIGILARKDASQSTEKRDPLEPLHARHFMKDPLETALSLVESGLDRWPQQTALLTTAVELNIWLGRISQSRRWMRRLPPDHPMADDSVEALASAYLEGDFERVQQRITDATLKNHGALTPTHRLLDLDLAVRSQDLKRISDKLAQMLQNHPWAQAALTMVVADAMRQEQPDRAFAVLGSVEQLNPQLASLTRSRLNVALGRAADALLDVEKVVAVENAGTEVRRWAAESRIRAHLLLDQQSLALGVCDQLSVTLTENKLDGTLAAADVLLALDKPTAAAEVLAEVAAQQGASLYTIDRVLARAEQVMKPSRIKGLIEALLTYRPGDPVLLIYQARAMMTEDDLVSERLLKTVIARHPQSPRARMEMAHLMRKVQPDEAVRIYTELSKQAGRTGETAQRLLEEMTQGAGKPSSAVPSTSASVEGFTE